MIADSFACGDVKMPMRTINSQLWLQRYELSGWAGGTWAEMINRAAWAVRIARKADASAVPDQGD